MEQHLIFVNLQWGLDVSFFVGLCVFIMCHVFIFNKDLLKVGPHLSCSYKCVV